MVQAAGAQSAQTVQDHQGFRTVAVENTASMVNCNLSCMDGTSFVYAKNIDKVGGKLFMLDSKVTDATHDTVQVASEVVSHQSDCVFLKYVRIQNAWFLIVGHVQTVIIFNHNATRRLYSYDCGKAFGNDNVNKIYFTCCSKAKDNDTGEEFIILGANNGSVHQI